MSNSPQTLTVVIPYAGECEYLEETMESVLANDSINEIVVGVDLSCVDRIAAETAWKIWGDESRKRKIDFLMVFSEKSGPAAVRNLAILNATSTIILPVDSDDCIAEDYVQSILKLYELDSLNTGIVYGKSELFGDAKGEWALPEYSLEKIVIENCIYATAGFRKEDWKRVGGYDEELIYGQEDWDFWLKIIGIGRTVQFIDKTVFYYRIRSNSRSAKFRGMWEQVIWTYDRVCKNNLPLMSSQVESIYHRRIQLELENRTLTHASKSLMIAMLRKFHRIHWVFQTRFFTLLKSKIRNSR
jgi:glycosyltransferase involved in cell wall biosynthesis